MFFRSERWRNEDATSTEAFEFDFFVMHWDEATFQHYDAVYCREAREKKVVSSGVQTRLWQLVDASTHCQAFIAADYSEARSTAMRLLSVSEGGRANFVPVAIEILRSHPNHVLLF